MLCNGSRYYYLTFLGILKFQPIWELWTTYLLQKYFNAYKTKPTHFWHYSFSNLMISNLEKFGTCVYQHFRMLEVENSSLEFRTFETLTLRNSEIRKLWNFGAWELWNFETQFNSQKSFQKNKNRELVEFDGTTYYLLPTEKQWINELIDS